MSFENILIEKKDGIFTIIVNRPKQLNALTKATIGEIGEAVKQANADLEVKTIIITGSGEKAFVAGADIKEFANFSPEEGRELSAFGHGVFNSIEQSAKPVIAAVNGFALGGGCELAMSCHIRVASENAKFSQPEVNLGVTPGYAGTQRLVQLIGKGKALELLMTADMVGSKEALSLGLVNYVTTSDQLMDKAKELANKIAGKSPMAISAVIRAVNAHFDYTKDGFQTEIDGFGKCFGTEDFKEGTVAFMERRKANFPGN